MKRFRPRYKPMRHRVAMERGPDRDLPDYLPADDDKVAETYDGLEDCVRYMQKSYNCRLFRGLSILANDDYDGEPE